MEAIEYLVHEVVYNPEPETVRSLGDIYARANEVAGETEQEPDWKDTPYNYPYI